MINCKHINLQLFDLILLHLLQLPSFFQEAGDTMSQPDKKKQQENLLVSFNEITAISNQDT